MPTKSKYILTILFLLPVALYIIAGILPTFEIFQTHGITGPANAYAIIPSFFSSLSFYLFGLLILSINIVVFTNYTKFNKLITLYYLFSKCYLVFYWYKNVFEVNNRTASVTMKDVNTYYLVAIPMWFLVIFEYILGYFCFRFILRKTGTYSQIDK